MGWLEDARKKAEDTAEEAKAKAAEKAATAAVAAAGAAVSKTVGGFFEGLVSSAEASLAGAEEAAKGRGLDLDGPSFEGTDQAIDALENDLETGATDPLAEAVRAVEARAIESEPVVLPPTPTRAPSDPFGDAERAIRMAREARGLDPNPPEPVLPDRSDRDPVEAALAAAAEARAFASSGGAVAQAKEDAARDQLAAMKAALGGSKRSDRVDDGPDDPVAPAKKRTL